jgi:prepilin-type N-terminal cleavage/methylation domain-containing protein
MIQTMLQPIIQTATPIRCQPPSGPSSRRGVTLLEVLVAMGILAIGLSSVAALMPAAGSRLADAANADRAGTLSANAYADVMNHGLAAADMFPGNSAGAACVFGKMLPAAVGPSNGAIVAAVPATVELRIDAKEDPGFDRGFILSDTLTYGPPVAFNLPSNVFVNNGAGPREIKAGVCWGGMLAPTVPGADPAPGDTATLSIAVFRKNSGNPPMAITLEPRNGVYAIQPADAPVQRKYVAGCSYVLALPPPDGTRPARWFKVSSSWADGPLGPSYAVFESAEIANYGSDSTPITALGFEGLLRVDEHLVTLE